MYGFDPDDYREHTCYKCEEKEDVLYKAKQFLREVVYQLYSKDPIDLFRLEDTLDEFCHLMDIKLIPGDLMIERKVEPKIAKVIKGDFFTDLMEMVK